MALKDSLESVSESMPDPQPAAIQAEKERSDETIKSTEGLKDKLGRLFNPSIHQIKDDQPVLNKDGTLRVKTGAGAANYQRGPQNKSTLVTKSPRPEIASADVGRGYADMIFTLGMMIGGEEWAPKRDEQTGQDERLAMYAAWERLAEEKGWNEVSPTMMVIGVTAAYAVPRFQGPKTINRLKQLKGWGAKRVLAFKLNGWRGLIYGESTEDAEDGQRKTEEKQA